MRMCPSCHGYMVDEAFYKYKCLGCTRDYARHYYRKNRDALLQKIKAARWADVELARQREREIAKRCYENNKDKRRESTVRWEAKNPGSRAERKRRRDARKTNATPPWVDVNALKEIYATAALVGDHVDHIIPLSHPLVCGLHVPWNLQVLPPRENLRKSNKFTPT